MGFKIVILVLIILICTVSQGMTQDTSNASPIIEELEKIVPERRPIQYQRQYRHEP
jgi:hypothetical protein